MDRADVVSRLREYIRSELLNRSDYPLAPENALITGGLIDSFSLAQIGVFIEEAFGVYLPDSELTVEKMDTLSLMADSVLKRQAK